MAHYAFTAMIVTSSDMGALEFAREKALELFPWVSPISEVRVNLYESFFIPPDGGAIGHDRSREAIALRARFKKILRSLRGPYEWVEVYYGGDNGDCDEIVDSSNVWPPPQDIAAEEAWDTNTNGQ